MNSAELGNQLFNLLRLAWLLPLAGFCVEIFGGYWSNRYSKSAAYLAIGCIGAGFLCSSAALYKWGDATDWAVFAHAEDHGEEHAAAHESAGESAEGAAAHSDGAAHNDAGGHEAAVDVQTVFSGTFYTFGEFGDLKLSLDYYIDSLTLLMFVMVTLIATCIHVFAVGYMSDELTDDYVDHHVHTASGGHFHRPGRFYQFFAYLSLFCFSMLGIVLAGNIFQVFVFWELVGICSYLLIGFYVERHSASTAANKAFIVNRVGDFGFIIGLMILWTYCGTFQFGDTHVDGQTARPGLFTMIRGADGTLDHDEARGVVRLQDGAGGTLVDAKSGEARTIPYMLLVVAGLGVFCGCVGKSAQFPLQTWLPDAMEGPTPVSALVHSATMVAAGVYLAGRFFPVFTPEVLLTIAYIGCITLFVAATIAVVATDIKRVLAYSTISQLGYMMLGIGVGGWAAGLFHLVTHAFFKSLMFLCSGSVIAGCHHEQEMPKMGGLLKKMPITALTMLVGVVAISGLAIPGTPLALSGYHSKDAILASALGFSNLNSGHFLLFIVPLITAGITAFYMFRLWFYTFTGRPRDQHVYDHCHESPWVMTVPLLVLSVFAAFCAVGGEGGRLFGMLLHSEPAGVAMGATQAGVAVGLSLPSHHQIHDVHATAGGMALFAAFSGLLVAFLLYSGRRVLDPGDIKRQLVGLHTFLVEKWRFDEVYDVMFVRPAHVVARFCAWIDRTVFDGLLHGSCRIAIDVSKWDRKFDEAAVDGLVNWLGQVTHATGSALRVIQTGRLRQYITFIAVGVLTLFVLLFAFFPAQ